ncbi:MAG: Xaa-Pro dipeptidase [Rudaea sp.]|uniref:Xaa-Pro dipeptidase n=1 Tax=unclassified Rudaea TaxID=2627037 RepID=UPI0010F9B8D3|nr:MULTISPECIES: Xaa-Pro dipeptidase [unclassified Rudaea]MBN8887178.1 Xaa-Pro dipeptidase [Rudaea sp.]MBR0346286.1 Xaa-Pro dipeptidase [Rudaea sp.]
MTDLLAKLYPDHLATLTARSDTALARGSYDHLVVAAGTPRYQFLDDRPYPFAVNPHFKHWLPVTKAPGSWLVYTPGHKPKLIYLQPHDYWHVVPEAPAGYWVEHFDIEIIREAGEAKAHLPANVARCAIVGEDNAAVGDYVPNNPQEVLDYLHWHRGYKTDYELGMLRVAAKLGTRAHLAAERAFRAGASEYDINTAYLNAVHETENELPYSNIIALNQHGAILHYTELNRAPPAHANSFLIDAGASFHGYASDITRTYAAKQAGEFQALIDAVDTAQKGFVEKVQKGTNYADLHLHAHHVLAGVLREHGFIRMSAEAAVASGVSNVFFPHGLGHPIGLQVHDVGGFQKDERGGTIEKPAGHPFLRMTRMLEPRMVVTIEPGLYFVDLLLAELKTRPEAKDIDWDKVDHFRQYGGIRIEDDVACGETAPENLTRDAFAAAA